jgi:hypothetical protein
MTASLLLVGIKISKSSVSVRPYSEQVINEDNFITAVFVKDSSKSSNFLLTKSAVEVA